MTIKTLLTLSLTLTIPAITSAVHAAEEAGAELMALSDRIRVAAEAMRENAQIRVLEVIGAPKIAELDKARDNLNAAAGVLVIAKGDHRDNPQLDILCEELKIAEEAAAGGAEIAAAMKEIRAIVYDAEFAAQEMRRVAGAIPPEDEARIKALAIDAAQEFEALLASFTAQLPGELISPPVMALVPRAKAAVKAAVEAALEAGGGGPWMKAPDTDDDSEMGSE